MKNTFIAWSVVIFSVCLIGCGQPSKAQISAYFVAFDAANAAINQNVTQLAQDSDNTSTLGISDQSNDIEIIQSELQNLKKLHVPNIKGISDWNDSITATYDDLLVQANNLIEDDQANNNEAIGDLAKEYLDIQKLQSLQQDEDNLKAMYINGTIESN